MEDFSDIGAHQDLQKPNFVMPELLEKELWDQPRQKVCNGCVVDLRLLFVSIANLLGWTIMDIVVDATDNTVIQAIRSFRQ